MQVPVASHSCQFFWILAILIGVWGFPDGSDGKESACHVGDPGSIPRLERSPGEFRGQKSLVSYSPWGHKET